MSWDQYSQTPASNDLSGYFQTGMAPSKVKNAGWDMMADLAQFMSLPTSGGTANAQTVTNTRQFGALFTGMWAVFVPSATNTGAMTLQVDGLAAKNVFCNGAAALAGQVVIGIPAWCRYDGTQWQLANPQPPSGSYTGTCTGGTTSPTGTITYRITADGLICTLVPGTGFALTSNTNAFTITGGPAIIQPLQTQSFYMSLEDATVSAAGSVTMTAGSGTITLGKGISFGGGGFTASGIKAWANGAASSQGATIVYCLK